MKRGSLVILNIGLVLIMFSAFGNNMNINYSIFVPGLIIAGIGTAMLLYSKKGNGKEK